MSLHRQISSATLTLLRGDITEQDTEAIVNAARFVIHPVGPVWQGGGRGEDELLGSAYRNSLLLAAGHRIRTIAFPSISTGAYGFPIDRASKIAFDTVSGFLRNDSPLEEVRFVVYSQEDYEVYAFLF